MPRSGLLRGCGRRYLPEDEKHAQGDIILEEDDGIYEKGDILRSFHYLACRPMSQKAMLVAFYQSG